MSKKVGRNKPCPCESGLKYKKCCWNKNFEWREDDAGEIIRRVPISPELCEMLKEHRQRFIEEHGREPRPDEPLFPDLPHPEHLEAELVEALKRANVRPEMIYATERTGRIVTEESYDNLTDAEQQEWEDAIDEYFERQAAGTLIV